MKYEYKIILFLMMLTFLNVHCASDSSSGDEDDALPEFEASESVEDAESDGVSVFEQLVEENEVGSESEPADNSNVDDSVEESVDDSTESENDGYLTIDELEEILEADGKTLDCAVNCE